MVNTQSYPVTIVVVVRERFSPFKNSLSSLFNTISSEIPVIVVDCGSPTKICKELKRLQYQRNFHWIHTPYFLLPNEARNLALANVQTGFVVFADNDLHYEQGWLEELLRSAKNESADVVAPLICLGPPASVEIHHAGGELCWREKNSIKYLDEVHRLADKSFAVDIDWDNDAPQTNRGVEFHCFLVRLSVLKTIGPLDARMISSEHIDFILRCLAYDFKIIFEKKSIVTYMAKQPFQFRDFGYFFFRWDLLKITQSINLINECWKVPIKPPGRYFVNWVKKHQQRAVVSFFPVWFARFIPAAWLLDLMKPYRYIASTIADYRRSGHMVLPTDLPRISSEKIELALKKI